MSVSLINSTRHKKIDDLLSATIGICEIAFPGRIRGYYISGSYANGTATPVSDLDFELVFKDEPDNHELEKAHQLSDYCNQLNDQSGFGIRSEGSLSPVSIVALKMNSLFLYGEDIRELITLPDLNAYIWQTMNQGISFISKRVRKLLPLIYPIDYPLPDEEFYGYFATNRTKDLLQSVFWAVTGIIALKTQHYVAHRSDGLMLYKKQINDEWNEFLEQLYDACKKWYHPPEGQDDRRHLHDLCKEVLKFENHFLQLYREYVLSSLATKQSKKHQLQIIGKLKDVIFLDKEMKDALVTLANSEDVDVRQSAQEAIEKMNHLFQ